MKHALVFLSLVFVSLLVVPANAQDVTATDNPRVVDFSAIDAWFAEPPTLEVNIDGVILRMLSRAAKESEPEVSSALARMQSIQVRSYDNTGAELAEQISSLSQQLEDQGWSRVVRVRDEGETVDVMLNATEDVISGISVFVFKPNEESVFVNIIGEISPEEIGRIGNALNISPLQQFDDYDFPES